jgi:hypothetical protein
LYLKSTHILAGFFDVFKWTFVSVLLVGILLIIVLSVISVHSAYRVLIPDAYACLAIVSLVKAYCLQWFDVNKPEGTKELDHAQTFKLQKQREVRTVLVECNWIKENQRIYQESCKVTPGTAD